MIKISIHVHSLVNTGHLRQEVVRLKRQPAECEQHHYDHQHFDHLKIHRKTRLCVLRWGTFTQLCYVPLGVVWHDRLTGLLLDGLRGWGQHLFSLGGHVLHSPSGFICSLNQVMGVGDVSPTVSLRCFLFEIFTFDMLWHRQLTHSLEQGGNWNLVATLNVQCAGNTSRQQTSLIYVVKWQLKYHKANFWHLPFKNDELVAKTVSWHSANTWNVQQTKCSRNLRSSVRIYVFKPAGVNRCGLRFTRQVFVDKHPFCLPWVWSQKWEKSGNQQDRNKYSQHFRWPSWGDWKEFVEFIWLQGSMAFSKTEPFSDFMWMLSLCHQNLWCTDLLFVCDSLKEKKQFYSWRWLESENRFAQEGHLTHVLAVQIFFNIYGGDELMTGSSSLR